MSGNLKRALIEIPLVLFIMFGMFSCIGNMDDRMSKKSKILKDMK